MDSATFNNSSFSVTGENSGLIDGSIEYNVAMQTASFYPSADFRKGEEITFILTADIQSESGNPLEGYISQFTVESDVRNIADMSAVIKKSSQEGVKSVFLADLNNDNYPDIITANEDSENLSVYLNSCDGFFGDEVIYPAGDRVWDVTAADFDGDGYIDIAHPRTFDSLVVVMFNDGTGNFPGPYDAYKVGYAPLPILAADLNGDSHFDLVTGNYTPDSISILFNNGDGTFGTRQDYPAGNCPLSLDAADLESDGDIDLFIGDRNGDSIIVMTNDGAGTFIQSLVMYSYNPDDIIAVDFNNDGFIDIATANSAGFDVKIYINNGDNTFASPVDYSTGGQPTHICSADLDGDGDLDIASSNAYSHDIRILENDGTGVFTATASFPSYGPLWISDADLDNDGIIELVSADVSNRDIKIYDDCTSMYDADGDGLCNPTDNCPFVYNPDQINSDADTLGDSCDNCPEYYNPSQPDYDDDGIGDQCDDDDDDDGILDDGDESGTIGDNPCVGGETVNCDDNCRLGYNPDQADYDFDGVGDVCDSICGDDSDGDFIGADNDCNGIPGDNPCTGGETENCDDNCPTVHNSDQMDQNSNGIGDLCESCCDSPGDANGNGPGCNILDITYMISFLYKGGPAPACMNESDVNYSCTINLLDITYCINYLYKGGPSPTCGCVE
jgi:hypothetical protein